MTQRDPATDFIRFRQLVHERLEVLLSQYGFKEAEANVLDPGMWVLLRNPTTQLEVQFEYGAGVWVVIRCLTASAASARRGEAYALDELLMLRAREGAPHAKMSEFDAGAIGDVLNELATALQQHADDVLRGDFEIFPQLAHMRSERAQPDPFPYNVE